MLGRTLLHHACLQDAFDTVGLLLDLGHPIDPESCYGWTPLRLAASPEMIRLLIDRGADVNHAAALADVEGVSGHTALHAAMKEESNLYRSRQRNEDWMKEPDFLELLGDPSTRSLIEPIMDDAENTARFHDNCVARVAALIVAGARTDVRDSLGRTPEDWRCGIDP